MLDAEDTPPKHDNKPQAPAAEVETEAEATPEIVNEAEATVSPDAETEAEAEPEHIFASLRMSDSEFTNYQRRLDMAYKRPIGEADEPIKVVGYGADAVAAVKASNEDGRDYIEARWGPIDSMVS